MFVVWRSLIKAWLCERDSNRLLQLLAHVELRMQKSKKEVSGARKGTGMGMGMGMGIGLGMVKRKRWRRRRRRWARWLFRRGGGGVDGRAGGKWETLRRLLAFSLPFKCLND